VLRRALLVWLVLFAAYAATLGLDAFDSSNYGGDEPHYLLAAHSLVSDGDLDVADGYVDRAYSAFYPYELDRHGRPTGGRLHEPHGVGFPLLIAPAFALGGAVAVELLVAMIAALAGAFAYALAQRVAPDPWAVAAALAVGLSPPLLAYGSAVYPELVAAAALAGGVLVTVRVSEDRARRLEILAALVALVVLPWLGTKFAPAGLVVGALCLRALWHRGQRVLATGGLYLAGLSVSVMVSVNEVLYGGPTPYAADVAGQTATDASFPGGYLERSYRLVALFLDRDYGLLRWAPVFALALAGGRLLWRARRSSLSQALPGHRAAERVGAICAGALAAQLLVAAFLAPTMFGFWFPPRHLLAALPLAVPLVAWGLRHHPRPGAALALVGLIASLWLYADVRLGDGGLAAGRPDAPWGPLVALFPFFGTAPGPYVLAGALAGIAAFLVLREILHSRQTAGRTRATYSG